MKLLVYDKFWDSFLKLGKETQKKVVAFQKKFRANPDSAAIHLEPISTFKDQSLRTARIDKKYRAIIRVPESGDAYHLLWVDNHDEAMAWAKNKRVPWNELTQSIQVFTVPETELTPTQQPATLQTPEGLYASYSDEQLLEIGVPSPLLPAVRDLESLDGLEALEQYLPPEAFENLFYLNDGASIDQLIFEVAEGRSEAAERAEQSASLNNQRSFIELTDNTLFNEVLTGSLHKWKYYLHPSQSKLVYGSQKGPVKISGGAGTGKTIAALHRLKHLVHQNRTDKPVLFSTYTKTLTHNLTNLASELDIEESKAKIINLSMLIFELAKDHDLITPGQKIIGFNAVKNASDIWQDWLETTLVNYDRSFLEKEFEQVILPNDLQTAEAYLKTPRTGRGTGLSRRQRHEVWQIMERFVHYKNERGYLYLDEVTNRVTAHLNSLTIRPFSHAIIDELQDFSNAELRFVRSLVEEQTDDLFLVGDPLQNIYNKAINFSKAGINIRGKRSKRLRINYRTTEEIKRLAVAVISDCHYDDFDGNEEEKTGYLSLFHGEAPTYRLFPTKDVEIAHVLTTIAQLQQADYNHLDIAIAARTKESLRDFKSAIHLKGIPYQELSGGKSSGQADGLSLLTFHNIKGLEFKHVFLVDVNERTFPLLPYAFQSWDPEVKKAHTQAEKSLMYVAMSRAIEGLYVSGTGRSSSVGGLTEMQEPTPV